MARQGKGQGDRRIQVGAGNMAGRIDHDHDHETKADRDAKMADRPACFRIDDDGPASSKDQCERADELCNNPVHVVLIFSR